MSTLTGSTNNNTCVFPILDLQTPNVSQKNEKLKISAHNQFFSNNNSVGGLSSYNNYFGTGIDGDVTVSSSAQISSSTSPAGLNNTLYGDVIVKNYKSLTINSGILFSPLNPCRGLLIYCTGDLTVNGTISMTGKGGGLGTKIAAPLGFAAATEGRYDLVDASFYVNNMSSSAYRTTGRGTGIPLHWNWAPSGSTWFSNYKIRIPLSGSVAGGAGGVLTAPTPAVAGTAGPAGVGCCGGGGGGGAFGPNTNTAGSGGRGTIFAGGGGGAGSPAGGSVPGRFESGGTGTATAGAGGAGNPPGVLATGGAGGLVILFVRGNVTINGSITSNGSAGGNAPSPGPAAAQSGAGGGSGGGRVMIIYGGTYTNSGTITVTGGAAGTTVSGGAAGSGGAGTTFIKKIHT
jgi:hypothetical protein